MMKRGALIAFEGCDRSGKTTQCQRVLEWLKNNNYKSHFMRFPDRTTVIGSVIGKYLECNTEIEDHAIHLLFSANRWEMVSAMKRLLNEGTNIIVDRYAFSGVAFSGAKPNMDLTWCKQSDVGLPKPDLVIYLDVNPVEAQKRGQYGSERYENLKFQEKVRENYMELRDETWKVVDANRSLNEIHTDVCNLVQSVIEDSCKPTNMGKLWV